MRHHSAWTGGMRDFRFPPLSPDLLRPGCSLHRATFDPDLGEEVFVFFREDPPYAGAYADVRPLTLIAHKGLLRTPAGVIAFIVWQIAAGTPQEAHVEQYLNPHATGTLKLVSDAAAQTHFKLVILDRSNGDICSFVDFRNEFCFDELVTAMAIDIGHEAPTDFPAAVAYAMQKYSVMDLIALNSVEGS